MQGMLLPCEADLHTGADAVNNPALMVIHRMMARHPGIIS
jgi:hypothetical protein